MEMITRIVDVFSQWERGPLMSYSFADPRVYSSISRMGLWQATLNPFLKTEADIQVKFGGFLEAKLRADCDKFTVHAELNPYKNHPQYWADLSIHDIADGNLWTAQKPNPIVETVRAVIEIKYVNYRDPDHLFDKGKIRQDLEKLAVLQPGVDRIFLVLDESLAISEEHIEDTRTFARDNEITVLSNNQKMLQVAAFRS